MIQGRFIAKKINYLLASPMIRLGITDINIKQFLYANIIVVRTKKKATFATTKIVYAELLLSLHRA